MSTRDTALTCHLVMTAGQPADTFVVAITSQLRDRFKIDQLTLRIERNDEHCSLKPEHVV